MEYLIIRRSMHPGVNNKEQNRIKGAEAMGPAPLDCLMDTNRS